MTEWYVRDAAGAKPMVGPVDTQLLIDGIVANKVGADVMVCQPGDATWKPIVDLAIFRAAFGLPPPASGARKIPLADFVAVGTVLGGVLGYFVGHAFFDVRDSMVWAFLTSSRTWESDIDLSKALTTGAVVKTVLGVLVLALIGSQVGRAIGRRVRG